MTRCSPLADHPDIRRFAADAAAILSRETGVTPEMVFGDEQTKRVARARHVLVFFLRQHAFTRRVTKEAAWFQTDKLPFTAIGAIIGGRDHTTIMASVRLVTGRLGDPRFEADRALVRRVAFDLQSRGYGPSDVSTFFHPHPEERRDAARLEGLSSLPGPPSFQRQAGVSKAIAMPKRSGDPKRQAVSAGVTRHDARSLDPAKHGDSGVSVSSERERA